MSNEQYLVVSYFTAVAAGVAMAVLTTLLLVGPLGKALAGAAAPLAQVLRRVLPVWVILAALLGFLSVSYFDCEHGTYEKIMADRPHLVATTFEQGGAMCRYVAAGLAAYAVALGLALFAHARTTGVPRAG